MAVHLLQLRFNGRTGDLGAAAVRAVVEVDQRGLDHAPEAQTARELVSRKDFATATLVQVSVMRYTNVFLTKCLLQLRPPGQSGDLGAAAQKAVAAEGRTDIARAQAVPFAKEIRVKQDGVTPTHAQVDQWSHHKSHKVF